MIIERNDLMQRGLNSFDMEICDAAYSILGTDWLGGPFCSPYTRVYFVRSGSGKIVCNKQEMTLAPGNVYLIPAFSSFSYRCDSKLEKLYFHIKFTGPDRRDAFAKADAPLMLKRDIPYVEKMCSLFKSSRYDDALILKSSLYGLMAEALPLCNADAVKIKSYGRLVRSALDMIDGSYKTGITPKMIAEKLFVSESKLRKEFGKEVGMPIGKYIRERILGAAETDVRQGNGSIGEISDRYGFCDQFYFARIFSEHYGVPPTAYRELTLKG